MPRFRELAAAGLLTFAALAGGWTSAQTAPAPSATSEPARPLADDPAPSTGRAGGIQGQNIFDVKPEVKRDASSEPGYMEQNNGQRNAVQPGNNSPMWRSVQGGVTGFTTLPRSQAPEAGNLIQAPVKYPGVHMTTAGEAWRQVRNHWIIPYGGSLLLIVLVAIGIFYFAKGKLGHNEALGGGGRAIERFTPFERAAHWTNAIAFCILAISGIVMAFGKFFLLPVMGSTLFGLLSYVLKNAHNFAGPLFAVSLAVVFFTFLRDNWPQRGDLRWLLRGGGLLSGQEIPSHRFNAGEKVVFWLGVLLLGAVVVGSGLFLDMLVPGAAYVRGNMQVAHMIHAVAAVAMMAVFIGHIYIGTIGMRGAYTAMRQGYVDEAWAKEHHEYWYDDLKAGKVPAQRSKPINLAAGDTGETVRPA